MNTIVRATESSMEKLSGEVSNDLKKVVTDTEALLKATANQGGEKLAEVRTKVEESLRVVKDKMTAAEEALLAKSKEAAKATDVYVHENPWKAIGVAVGFGVVIGLLIGRR